MKKVFLIGLLIAGIIMAQGVWQPPVRLTNNSTSDYNAWNGRGIATDNEGNVYVVWYTYVSPRGIRLRKYDAATSTWLAEEQVRTGNNYTPSVAARNASDGCAVAWYYYPYTYVRHRDNAGSYGSVSSIYGYYYPSVAAGGTAPFHIISRYRYSNYYVRYWSYNGTSLTGPEGVSSSRYYYNDVAVDADGNVLVAYTDNSPRGLYFRRKSGGSWETERVISTDCRYYYSPSIAVGPDGTIHAVWVSYSSPYSILYSYSMDDGQTWSTPEDIDGTTSSCYYPSVAVDTGGVVWVFWQDYRDGNAEIYYNRRIDGTWEGAQALTPDDDQYSYRPHVAADSSGNIHVTWYDRRDGNYEIYYQKYVVEAGGGGRDVAMWSIEAPVGNIPPEPLNPEGVVRNYGDEDEHVKVHCVITGPGSDYDEWTDITVPAGDYAPAYFPEWTPPGEPGDEYDVMMEVKLFDDTEDDDPSNDVMEVTAVISVDHDIAVSNITEPAPGTEIKAGDELKVIASFINNGLNDETDVPVKYELKAEDGSVIHTENGTIESIASGEEVEVEFPSWIVEGDFTGDLILVVSSMLDGDQMPDNDTMSIGVVSGIEEDYRAPENQIGIKYVSGGVIIEHILHPSVALEVEIYSADGRKIEELEGVGRVEWRYGDTGNGVYFVRVRINGEETAYKVVVVK